MHIFFEPSTEQIERTRPLNSCLPGWFATPISHVCEHVTFGRKATDLWAVFNDEQNFLIFNVGVVEGLFDCIRSKKHRVISLHQWAPAHISGGLSFSLRNRILERSEIIVTYSMLDHSALKQRFPRKHVQRIGHYVDLDFFDPRITSGGSRFSSYKEYFLAVGDHLRYEDHIIRLAQYFGYHLVRISRDDKVKKFYEDIKTPANKFTFLGSVDFLTLRNIYADASLVLNVVNDRYWPVGITSFCEALAMEQRIVTSAFHSCSGFAISQDPEPYWKVREIDNFEAWKAAIILALGTDLNKPALRQIAMENCSLASLKRSWLEVLSYLS